MIKKGGHKHAVYQCQLVPWTVKEGQNQHRKKITDVIREEMPNVPDQNIWITFSEIPADEWAIGGKMCAGGKD